MLRKHWSKAEVFDAYLREKILLSRKEGCCQESHPIWSAFQPKFMLTCDLINYYEFFERCLVKICKIFIKQSVFILELRHIFGMIIDDKGGKIGVSAEIDIFTRVQEKFQRDYPLFQMPKPAVHHCHVTAAAPVDFLIELTYRDYVYYNDRAQLFKVSKNGITEEGY